MFKIKFSILEVARHWSVMNTPHVPEARWRISLPDPKHVLCRGQHYRWLLILSSHPNSHSPTAWEPVRKINKISFRYSSVFVLPRGFRYKRLGVICNWHSPSALGLGLKPSTPGRGIETLGTRMHFQDINVLVPLVLSNFSSV